MQLLFCFFRRAQSQVIDWWMMANFKMMLFNRLSQFCLLKIEWKSQQIGKVPEWENFGRPRGAFPSGQRHSIHHSGTWDRALRLSARDNETDAIGSSTATGDDRQRWHAASGECTWPPSSSSSSWISVQNMIWMWLALGFYYTWNSFVLLLLIYGFLCCCCCCIVFDLCKRRMSVRI